MGVYTSLFCSFLTAEPKSSSKRDIPILKSVPILEGVEGSVQNHLKLGQSDLRIFCEFEQVSILKITAFSRVQS